MCFLVKEANVMVYYNNIQICGLTICVWYMLCIFFLNFQSANVSMEQVHSLQRTNTNE